MARIDICLVNDDDRLRGADTKKVKEFTSSLREIGLISPIIVYPKKIRHWDTGVWIDGYGLIAGYHRLEAARKLGWEQIDADIRDEDEMRRKLIECDENLIRAELTPVQRAKFTAARKEAYEFLHPETKHGVAGGRGNRNDKGTSAESASVPSSFVKNTAQATGKAERTVQIDAQRGQAIAQPVLEAIEGTSMDKGAVLDQLAKEPVEKQMDVLQSLAAKKDEPTESDKAEKDFSKLMKIWSNAEQRARREFCLAKADEIRRFLREE